MWAPNVLVTTKSRKFRSPCWDKNPAKGSLTSLGKGGKIVSRKVKRPTPRSPNLVIRSAAIPTIPDRPSVAVEAASTSVFVQSLGAFEKVSLRGSAA